MNNHQLRIITLFFLILCIALYFYTAKQQAYYDQQARPAVNDILMDIGQWQKPALLEHLSSAARKTTPDQKIEQLLIRYQQFGALQSFEPLQFSRLASVFSLLGDSKINYQTNAKFELTEGHINITLVNENGHYKIYNLSINPVTQ